MAYSTQPRLRICRPESQMARSPTSPPSERPENHPATAPINTSHSHQLCTRSAPGCPTAGMTMDFNEYQAAALK